MSIETKLTEDNKYFYMIIVGVFDFTVMNEFRNAYGEYTDNSTEVVVDMRGTTTIDSSALGMLLIMQEKLDKRDREIRIINCNPDILRIFEITKFDTKFKFE